MVILHIAALNNSAFSGVSVVVPEHVKAQEQYAETALMNILDYKVTGVKLQLDLQFDIDLLPEPYNKPDIVVFHQLYYASYLKIWKKIKKKGIPYIIVPHGCLSKEALKIKWLKKIIGNKLFFNSFIKKAIALQCLSDGEASDIKYKNFKIVSTNGFQCPLVKKERFLINGKIRIVYIGRLEIYHKGLDILLEAMASIKSFLIEKNVELSIYGPDKNESHKKLVRIIKDERLDNLVTVNNGISGKEKEKTLLSSDIFIQTSRFEGMPMGILEAMAYGVPVVITKGTTLGELVSKYNAGWVSDTTVGVVADVLKKAIEEKCWLEVKSESARKLVFEEFDWRKIAKEAVEKYEQLIKCRSEV